jgi:hypothetical protein
MLPSQYSSDTIWTAQKMTPRTILRCRGKVFNELLPSNDRAIHRLFFEKTRAAQKMSRQIILLSLRVYSLQ